MSIGALRVALVTGAGRGIGLSISRALLDQGCKVVMTDIDLDRVRQAAQELDDSDNCVLVKHLDVTDSENWEQVILEVQAEWGDVDILVNNAGIMVLGDYLELNPSLDERQVDINIWGVLHGQRSVLPSMLSRGQGHIVNIASAAGQVGIPYAAIYSATKFAVVGMTEAVAYEYKGTGVHFTAVCPSLVETELVAGAGRPIWPPAVSPEDVAKAVVRAIQKKKELVFVPRVARLSIVLPAILPHRVARKIAEVLNMGEMFQQIDDDARSAYRKRARSSKS